MCVAPSSGGRCYRGLVTEVRVASDGGVSDTGLDETHGEGDHPARDRLIEVLPLVVFVAAVVVALPILLFEIGRYHWFLRDEWMYFVERRHLTVDSLFEPFNVHPAAVPVFAYIVLWNLFGLESYRPYQAVVIGLHLSVVVILRALMRNAGVRPWLATIVAGSFIFFGPGSQNIIWAFQIGFTGSIAFGLAQLLLADHDGPITRRDRLGLLCGLLSVMSAGTGVSVAMATGLGLLGRRGLKAAAFHTVPLAATFVIWSVVQEPSSGTHWGAPSVGAMYDWMVSGTSGSFMSVGQNLWVASVLAAVTVGGLVLAWITALREPTSVSVADGSDDDHRGFPGRIGARLEPRRVAVQHLAIPTALFVACFAFMASTGWTRWGLGTDVARSSRYLHAYAALLLPAMAVGAEALARRWRVVTPAMAVLLLVALPGVVGEFGSGVFDERYMDERRRILTTAVRMPFAREVPPDVRPVPDPYDGDLTIGFLLEAADAGKLKPYPWDISPSVENEMRIRLGLAQRTSGQMLVFCVEHTDPIRFDMRRGDVIGLGAPVEVRTVDGDGQISSPPVLFAARNGRLLVAELDDLHVELRPARSSTTFALCEVP